MATKDKKPATKKAASSAKITRITAKDTVEPAKKTTSKVAKKAEVVTEEGAKRRNPIKATGGYFAGAWYELKQVRWPNRRATWSLTGAMLAFTAFFVVLVLLLDALFKFLFEKILG